MHNFPKFVLAHNKLNNGYARAFVGRVRDLGYKPLGPLKWSTSTLKNYNKLQLVDIWILMYEQQLD